MGVKKDDSNDGGNVGRIIGGIIGSKTFVHFNTPLKTTTMKKLFMVLAATIICGATTFTSCTNDDNPATPDLGVKEKIIGKWVTADVNGQSLTTNDKMVITFVSTTKAYMSASFNAHQGAEIWGSQMEVAVAIDGNKVTFTNHSDEHTTGVEEYTITAINDNDFTANQKVTVTVDGTVVHTREGKMRYKKVTADYSAAILGLWECQGITGGETNNDDNARLEFLADGTYRFYRRSDAGVWSLVPRQRNEYFVDGNLLCTRWQAEGEQMSYEWWEIASAADGRMQWTALRQQPDGSTFQQGVAWTAAEARTVLASMDFKGHPFYGDLTYSYAYDDDCRLVKMKEEQVGTGLVIAEFDYIYTPSHIKKQGREEAYTVTEECSLDDHGRIVELVHNSINDETQKEYHYTYTYTYDEDGHLTTVSQWIEGEPNALLTTFAWQDGELRSKTTDQSSVLMVYGYEPGEAPAQALFSRNGYSEADELCPQGCFGTLPLHLPAKQTVTLTLNGVEMSKRTTEYTYTVTAGRLTSASDTYNYFLHWEMR